MAQHAKTRSNKRHILATCARAFAEKGYFGTSTRALSEASGFEQSSLYHHFTNKENLYRESLLYSHSNILRILNRRIDKSGSLEKEISSLFDTFHHFNARYGGQMFLLFSLVFSGPRKIANEYATHYFCDFADYIRRAFKRNPPPEQAAEKLELVIDLLHGFFFALSSQARVERLTSWKSSLHYILEKM